MAIGEGTASLDKALGVLVERKVRRSQPLTGTQMFPPARIDIPRPRSIRQRRPGCAGHALRCHRTNMPLYQLFGGKCREGVPIYRHADGKDLNELCDNVQRFREQRITHIRCQSGGYGGGSFGYAPSTAPKGAPDGIYLDSKKYMRDTLKLFDGIRSKVGFDVALCHDVHERLKPIEAIRFACELEQFDLFLLEDAIALDEGEWIRQWRAKTSTPLAQGELFNNPSEWKFPITERLIDFIRVHLSQIGGITAGRKLQIFAEQFGLRTVWHGPDDMSPLAHAANIHIDLASRNFGVQEWSDTEPPNFVIQELKGPRGALLDVFPSLPEFRNGYVYANEKPGLGVDINQMEAVKYPCENTVTTWTQTRLADGTLQTP
jgi:mannonate dehydratase